VQAAHIRASTPTRSSPLRALSAVPAGAVSVTLGARDPEDLLQHFQGVMEAWWWHLGCT